MGLSMAGSAVVCIAFDAAGQNNATIEASGQALPKLGGISCYFEGHMKSLLFLLLLGAKIKPLH